MSEVNGKRFMGISPMKRVFIKRGKNCKTTKANKWKNITEMRHLKNAYDYYEKMRQKRHVKINLLPLTHKVNIMRFKIFKVDKFLLRKLEK